MGAATALVEARLVEAPRADAKRPAAVAARRPAAAATGAAVAEALPQSKQRLYQRDRRRGI